MIPRLLAITPPHGAVDDSLVRAAAVADVDIAVLIREPGASPQALLDPQGRLAPLCRAAVNAGIPVLLSCDPTEAATAAVLARNRGLQGVQVRGDPTSAVLLRVHAAWPDGVVGRSVHHEPPQTWTGPDHYAVFAPVFAPRTATPTPKPPTGTEPLARWCRVHSRMFALGGVTPKTAAQCLEAGAWGFAGISTFLGSTGHVADTLQALATMLSRPRDVPPPPRG